MNKYEQKLKNFIDWENENPDINKSWLEQVLGKFIKHTVLMLRPNVAIRYKPVAKFIKESGSKPNILEVGSGSLGISRFINIKITGVDLDFSGPRTSNLDQVYGSAINLPFDDNSFDYVLSLDVMEHLPEEDRKKMIKEMIRVSSQHVVIGVPCGARSVYWERKMQKVCDRAINRNLSDQRKQEVVRRSFFLTEHEECGLPDENQMLRAIYEGARNLKSEVSLITKSNESLWVWYLLTYGSIRINNLAWLFTSFFGAMTLPILSMIKWGGCYRKIFFINKKLFSQQIEEVFVEKYT